MSNEHESTIRELQTSLMRLHEEKVILENENKRLQYDLDSWVAAAERFSILSYKAKSEMNSFFTDIYNAIKNEGPSPRTHRRVMMKHRREWPALWSVVDRVIEKVEKCQN